MRLFGAVERRFPDVRGQAALLLESVQDVRIVEPLHLVVDAPRLTWNRGFGHAGEVEYAELPDSCVTPRPFLVGQPRIVRRKRWALHVFVQDAGLPRRNPAFDQVGFATRAKRRIEAVV